MPVSPYVVEEISGLGRGISLRGRSLPYQGTAYNATQRVEQTWNPGNPVATVQIDGPEFDDVTINGMWKDTFLFDEQHAPVLSDFASLAFGIFGNPTGGSPVATQTARRAEIAMFAFEQLRKAASPVRIEWGSIVRYGVVHKTSFKFDRIEDITWEITFKISGERPNQPKPELRRDIDVTSRIEQIIGGIVIRRLAIDPRDPLGLFDRALGLLNVLNSALQNILFFREGFSLASITGSILRFNNLVTELLSTLEGFANLVFFPLDVIGTLRATLKNIQLEAQLITDRFKARAAAISASGVSPAVGAGGNAMQQFLRDRAKRVAADAVAFRRDLERLDAPEVRSVVRMRSGETLRDIARQWFGVEDDWREIASFNGFSTSIVPTGTLIRIPVR